MRTPTLTSSGSRPHCRAPCCRNPSSLLAGLELTTPYAAASQEALVVGDVFGKGLAAAARMAEIKYALRAYLREMPDPGAALTSLSAFLYDNLLLARRD